ncbi:MAG: hypothetical protein JSW43_02705 [Gemmatimonadota bacterium]|nr:MAG: hypothetical protein JSW43_02705 [Gemmatimonadota bacterium]
MRSMKRALGAALALGALAFAGACLDGAETVDPTLAKGGIPGPPSGGEVSNNLSLPAVLTGSVPSVAHYWTPPAEPQLGVHYSYGCGVPESDGQFEYPNTSCVNSLSEPTMYYDAAACTAAGAPCEGYEVSRIYWQKVDANAWSADADGTGVPASAAYVDWGDALEAVSWSEKSQVRVETQPYSSTIAGFDPQLATCAAAATDPAVDCKVGFQMWHVSGQGITEHWGVRATDADAAVSYNYDSPFQIIHTSNAMLNIAKMVPGDAVCPNPGEGELGELPPTVGPWDPALREWEGTLTYRNAPYTVELSVGGKYVYGFNWRVRDVVLDEGWLRTGYWRLTFYTTGDEVLFDDPFAPVHAPPASASEVRVLPRTLFNSAVVPPSDPGESDALYTPVVDVDNNLTYLDICIVEKDQGGGGGGNGGKGGGGGGGGGGGPGGGNP